MTDELNRKLDEILMWLKLQCPDCETICQDIHILRVHMMGNNHGVYAK